MRLCLCTECVNPIKFCVCFSGIMVYSGGVGELWVDECFVYACCV